MYCFIGMTNKQQPTISKLNLESLSPKNVRSNQSQTSNPVIKINKHQKSNSHHAENQVTFNDSFDLQPNAAMQDAIYDSQELPSKQSTERKQLNQNSSGLKPPKPTTLHGRKISEISLQVKPINSPSERFGLPQDDQQSNRSLACLSQDSYGAKSQASEEEKFAARSRAGSRILLINPTEINENKQIPEKVSKVNTSRSNNASSFVDETQPHGVEWVHTMRKYLGQRSRRSSQSGLSDRSKVFDASQRKDSEYKIVVADFINSERKARMSDAEDTLKKSSAELENLLKQRVGQYRNKLKGSNNQEVEEIRRAESGEKNRLVNNFCCRRRCKLEYKTDEPELKANEFRKEIGRGI